VDGELRRHRSEIFLCGARWLGNRLLGGVGANRLVVLQVAPGLFHIDVLAGGKLGADAIGFRTASLFELSEPGLNR
jgi:hypothetical protein